MAIEKKPLGIRKKSAVVATVAAPVAPATAVTLFQRSAGGTIPRTVRLCKIWAWNPGANAILEIGTGGILAAPVFAQIIPPMRVVGGAFDTEWTELEIPEDDIGVGADLTMECDVDNVMVQVEIEEIETRVAM